MKETSWEKALEDLRDRLDLIQSQAREDSAKFQELWRQAEYTKVQFLVHQLEAWRKHLARRRGIASFTKNKKGLPLALGMAAVESILTGIMTRDGIAAVNAGAKGLSGTLKEQGDTDWAVCLGKHLAVAPQNNITLGDIWVTWDSLQTALRDLEERAKSGAQLGDIDSIISELKKNRKLRFVIRQPQVERPSSVSEPRL
ncbi:hypothetical protein ACFLUR_01530 [Chloroflexota bacterium]